MVTMKQLRAEYAQRVTIAPKHINPETRETVPRVRKRHPLGKSFRSWVRTQRFIGKSVSPKVAKLIGRVSRHG